MGHKMNYREIKEGKKKHIAGLAEQPPDPQASERFRAPAYQAGSLVLAQDNLSKIRWIDLIDYMLRHVMDGSIKLSDPVVLTGQINDGHIDVAEYLASKYDIRRGVGE